MAASWQDYVNTQLVASGGIDQAMMVGKQDAAVWAATPDFVPRLYNGVVTQEDGSEGNQTINEAVSACLPAGRPLVGARAAPYRCSSLLVAACRTDRLAPRHFAPCDVLLMRAADRPPRRSS